MGQGRILGIDAGGNLVHAGALRKDGGFEPRHSVFGRDEAELALVLDMEGTLAVGTAEEHLNAEVVGLEVARMEDHFGMEVVVGGKAVGSVGLGVGNHLDIVPFPFDVFLPCGYVAGLLVVVGNQRGNALALRLIVLVDVVGQHAVGGEVACHLGDAVRDVADPAGRQAGGGIDVVDVDCGMALNSRSSRLGAFELGTEKEIYVTYK